MLTEFMLRQKMTPENVRRMNGTMFQGQNMIYSTKPQSLATVGKMHQRVKADAEGSG
jgi:hypothetical protein